jgi:hypothetical protein
MHCPKVVMREPKNLVASTPFYPMCIDQAFNGRTFKAAQNEMQSSRNSIINYILDPT